MAENRRGSVTRPGVPGEKVSEDRVFVSLLGHHLKKMGELSEMMGSNDECP